MCWRSICFSKDVTASAITKRIYSKRAILGRRLKITRVIRKIGGAWVMRQGSGWEGTQLLNCWGLDTSLWTHLYSLGLFHRHCIIGSHSAPFSPLYLSSPSLWNMARIRQYSLAFRIVLDIPAIFKDVCYLTLGGKHLLRSELCLWIRNVGPGLIQ